MPSNVLREGFRDVFRDPALLLIEVAWRWTFGIIAILACATVAFLTATGVKANPQALESMSRMNPWELAQSLASVLTTIAAALVRVGIVAIIFLACCWIVLSALGRRATLLRPALAPGADLRSCFSISTVRALVTLGSFVAWILASVLAGAAGAVTNSNSIPNLGLILLILLPALLVIVGVWSAANWYLSLAPLFQESSLAQSVRRAWILIRSRRDEVLEISIATGVIRLVLLIMALVLSFAVSAVIANPRVIVADFSAIALLYFLAADFVSIARLAALAKLRDGDVEADHQFAPAETSAPFLIRSE